MKNIILISSILVFSFLLTSNTAQAQSGNNSNANTPSTSTSAASIPNNQTENGSSGSTSTSTGSTQTTAMAETQNQTASTGGQDVGNEVKEVESPKTTVVRLTTTLSRSTALTQGEINGLISSMKSEIQGVKYIVFIKQSLS